MHIPCATRYGHLFFAWELDGSPPSNDLSSQPGDP